MEHKKFMDISRIKEDTEVTKDNTTGFEVGDFIVIQEKVDGSNASIAYDRETDRLVAFSRKYELRFDLTLSGFWNWVQTLEVAPFRNYPDYVFFGEWLVPHAVPYISEAYEKFYFYDVYDKKRECYLSQDEVKCLAGKLNFIYVKTYYEGAFVSWEHCKSFMGVSDIAVGIPEGIVVKNQSKLNADDVRTPFVLKIVNERNSEVDPKKRGPKQENTKKLENKEAAKRIVEQIVTKNRVRKELYKMAEEGIVPGKIGQKDMKAVAKMLPPRIYADCMKEEPELVMEAGEYFSRMCNAMAMNFAKEIVFEKAE